MAETEVSGIRVTLDAEDVSVGLVVGRSCATGPAPEGLNEALEAAIASAKARTGEESITQPVRNLLRYGTYKPTGRGKPASEYLLKAARGDKFPRINNLVDLNNLVSLNTLLPISLVDLNRAGATAFTVRRGRAEEAYVFNTAGQEIALRDLLLVARAPDDTPCANPVKDSMATKLDDNATDVMAVIYAPPSLPTLLDEAVRSFAKGFETWADANSVESATLPSLST